MSLKSTLLIAALSVSTPDAAAARALGSSDPRLRPLLGDLCGTPDEQLADVVWQRRGEAGDLIPVVDWFLARPDFLVATAQAVRARTGCSVPAPQPAPEPPPATAPTDQAPPAADGTPPSSGRGARDDWWSDPAPPSGGRDTWWSDPRSTSPPSSSAPPGSAPAAPPATSTGQGAAIALVALLGAAALVS